MEENYYDILEVNKNASPEIIEKAYKTLVKKYHPDLQENNLKENYEEKLKKINEAYEILSNPEKRKNYDLNLKNIEFSKDDYNNLINENTELRNEINYLKNNIKNINNYQTQINQNNIHQNNSQQGPNYQNINYQKDINQAEINQKINNAVNKAYYDAYIQDLKNRGYKIKYKKTLKDFIALILTIIVISFVGFILWQIPFTKSYLISFYNDNPIIKFLVDCIINIFK